MNEEDKKAKIRQRTKLYVDKYYSSPPPKKLPLSLWERVLNIGLGLSTKSKKKPK